MKTTTGIIRHGIVECITIGLVSCSLSLAQPPSVPSKSSSPMAVAKAQFDQSIAAATKQCILDLKAAGALAMQFNNLDEANAVASAIKRMESGEEIHADFKTGAARTAAARHAQTITRAKQQYMRQLEIAQKAAMAAANLDQANAIDAIRKKLADELKTTGAARTLPTSNPLIIGGKLKPGLLVKEYPRHKNQTGDDAKNEIPIEELGEPIGKSVVIKSLFPWKHDSERNAVASGFLRIEADGEYAFCSNSFYDRNVLIVDGQVVCPYRDGVDKFTTAELKKGMVPFVSIGYFGGREDVIVTWRPPAQSEFSEIPGKLLLH